MPRRLIAFLCSIPLAQLLGQEVTAPWSVLSSHTVSVPYSRLMALTPLGDVVVAGSSADHDVTATLTLGDTSLYRSPVSKIDTAGKLRFTVLIGGVIQAQGLAFDLEGNIYVTGEAAAGLATTPGAFRSSLPPYSGPPLPVPGMWRMTFACKLRASDGVPIYCTYLDVLMTTYQAVAEASGALYLAGRTLGQQPDTSITKLDSKGSQLLYRKAIPGADLSSVVVERAGSVFFSGAVVSPEFVFNPPATPGDPTGATFLAKLDPAGSKVVFARQVEVDRPAGFPAGGPIQLAVDREGAVFAAGPADGQSVFIRKYDGSNSAVIYDRRFPLKVMNGWYALGVDEAGRATLFGTSSAAKIPLYENFGTCTGEASSPYGGNGYLLRVDRSGELLQSSWTGADGMYYFRLSETGAWAFGSPLYLAPPASPTVSQGLQVFRFGAGRDFAERKLACVANAATGWITSVAPGGIVTLLGSAIGPTIPALGQPGPDKRFPTDLAEYSVTLNGEAAPLLYASDSQINAIAPWSLAGNPSAEICVKGRGETVGCLKSRVSGFSAGIFDSSPGRAAAINQDGTVNTADNPAPAGSVVSIYATGLGMLSPMPRDGAILEPPLPDLQSSVRVLMPVPENRRYPVPAEVLYAGPAPFAVAGLFQINFRVPPTTVPGAPRVTIEVCAPRPCIGTNSQADSSLYVGAAR